MTKRISLMILILMGCVAIVACTSQPALTTVPPLATATQAPAATSKPADTAVPTKAPTASPVPTQAATATTIPPTQTTVPPTVPPTAVAPTAIPSTAVPTATSVPPTAAPAGLYVTNVKIVPDRPAFNQDVSFVATFVNTASGDQNVKWAFYIFKADAAATSNNETTALLTAFPTGTRDFASLGSFRYGTTGRPCEYFFTRVGFFNSENKVVWFANSDGKTYEKGFQVCDASLIPTAVPASAASTAVPPTPKPGLFVTDFRIQPAAQRGADLTFFPTFLNNSGNTLSFTWRVLIYKADNSARSYSETTWLQSNFASNSGEVQSLGKWNLALGGPCENYFARVGWLDVNNQTQLFVKPDGTVFEKSFTVCPP